MIKSYIKVFAKLAHWKIILFYVVVFCLALLFPYKVIPDFFKLGMIAEKRDLIFRLLSTTLGFSGILLTVLLVAYNFYIKTTRRNTLEFILNNQWLQIIFSVFVGNVLFLILGFLFTGLSYNDTTVLYCCFCFTFLFILSLFPLALLSLNDSVSLKRIDAIFKRITEEELEQFEIMKQKPDVVFNEMEKHPVLLLKDIAVNAISDKDWFLPQSITRGLYMCLIYPLDGSSAEKTVMRNYAIWAMYSRHLKREVIKQENDTIASYLWELILFSKSHIGRAQFFCMNGGDPDSEIHDFVRLTIQHNVFNRIQSQMISDLAKMLLVYFDCIYEMDEELPTREYEFVNGAVNSDYNVSSIRRHWEYMTNTLPDVIFDTIRHAIAEKRENIYKDYGNRIKSLIRAIVGVDNLTIYQKHNAVNLLMFKSYKLAEFSISQQVTEGIFFIHRYEIGEWMVLKPSMGHDALFYYGKMIMLLHTTKTLRKDHIDDYFEIIHMLCKENDDPEVLKLAATSILENVTDILHDPEVSAQNKRDLLSALMKAIESYTATVQADPVLLQKMGELFRP